MTGGGGRHEKRGQMVSEPKFKSVLQRKWRRTGCNVIEVFGSNNTRSAFQKDGIFILRLSSNEHLKYGTVYIYIHIPNEFS